ncbi:MAG: hypothetical protein R3249_03035 [Nitriliruptorales bacterium]|nr:hypothetical protein [Nitriliruptorales bacterium]
MPRPLSLLPLLIAVACSASPATLSAADLEDLVTGLCAAVERSDATESEAAFFGRAHAPLHTLADTLRERELTVAAADLLVAKQRVEASYTQGLPPPLLHDNLRALVVVTDDGLEALRLRPLDCDQGT